MRTTQPKVIQKAIMTATSATKPAISGSPRLAIQPSIMWPASHGLWWAIPLIEPISRVW